MYRLYWKLYLWDEITQELVTFTNKQLEIRDDGSYNIPTLPVILAINVLYDERTPRAVITHDRNYYGLVGGREWYAMTLSGLHNYIDTRRGNACLLRGVIVSNEDWLRFYQMAKQDPEIQQVVSKVGQRRIDRDNE